jgi:hypothetical protein
MLRPRLETITPKLSKPLTSNKDKRKVTSKLRLEMTTIGSQMRISSVSFITQTPSKSSKVKIAELESPLSMMTSPDKFASRRARPSRPSLPKKLLKLLSLERMDLTALSRLTMRPFNLIAHPTLHPQELITSM